MTHRNNFFEDFFNLIANNAIGVDAESFLRNEKFPKYEIFKDEADKRFLIKILLAGYKKEDINIEIKNNILTISSQKQDDVEEGFISTTPKAIATRQFSTKFTLNSDIEIEQENVSFENGILKIYLSRKPDTASTKIDIK